ncbi:hypothetical protein BKA65DRAFT_388351, partial [Rhexocercosporidium sp. MPI-PUGE-AT-0058]
PGQRNSVLAIISPRPAEQVILVIKTGLSKTIVIIISVIIVNIKIIILILLIIALRNNILRRFHEVSIRLLI